MKLTRIVLVFVTAAMASWAAQQSPKLEAYTKLPLSFEVNQGQTDPQVKYLARGMGYITYLTGKEAVIAITGPSPMVIRMKLSGASPAEPSGIDEMAGKSNYIIGSNPARWRTGIATFAKVEYPRVYPGIDLVYHGNQRQLEYDFVVAPGADPGAIRLEFPGSRAAQLDPSGDLVLGSDGQECRFHKPVVYQTRAGGGKDEVDGRYVLQGSQVAFELGEYDRTRPVVIDPILRSTFLGGAGNDIAYGIAVDQAGFSYVTGSTASANFPAPGCIICPPGAGGASDAFVTVFNPAGGYVYSTYLGGGGNDVGRGIAVPRGVPGGPLPVYVTGSTTGGFPLLAAVQPAYGGGPSDAFVTSLNPAGLPIYSTYLGGAGNDVGYGISVGLAMNAYVTGSTNSPNYPRFKCLQCALGGGTDAFVTALPPAGGPFLYSTFLGGAGNDVGYGISVDNLADVGVTGTTNSPNFPVVVPCAQCVLGGGTDAFISFLTFKPGPPPQPGPPVLTWSTYWGGPANENGYGITADNIGTGWITGSTNNKLFPLMACVQCAFGGGASDAIVVSFQRIPGVIFSDYLGGALADIGYGITESNQGTALLTGVTNSPNFPVMACFQCAIGGGSDAFVAEYTPGARVFSTFMGGVRNDAGRGIASNPISGLTYVTGSTSSFNFPIVAPCTQCALPGGPSDAFVAVIR